nr:MULTISPECIES: DNA sulfur modification protein DndB [unclassified Leptolyngbya]
MSPQPTRALESPASAPASEPANYLFPCVRGIQCGDDYWLVQFTFDQLHTLLHPFFERPKVSAPLSLAQRTLDPRRAKKIARYVITGLSQPEEFYILLPIVITVDIPEWECYDFQALDLEIPGMEGLGLLGLPGSATFWVPDGQHRSWGAIQARLEAPGLTANETIGVMLIPDAEGQKRQRIFLDANQHGVKPNKSIISLFDHRDPYSDIARAVLTSVDIFRDRTALESTNIQPKSGDVFTLNSLRESCKLLLLGAERDLHQEAIRFWRHVAQHHPHWKLLQTSNDPTLRQHSIGFNALTLCALAIVGQELRQQQQLTRITKLERINWRLSNPDWNLCKLNNRIVKNRDTMRAMATYILERIAD